MADAKGTQTTYSASVVPQWYTNYAQQILSNQMAASQQPYQAYEGQRVAGFNPTQTQGFDMTKAAATSHQPGMNTAMNATQNTLGRSGFGVAQPMLGQAQNLMTGAADPTGLNMAQPYLDKAGQTSVAGVNQYMNPFLENVVNRYGELGARTLREQLAPAISNKFISSGQLMGGAASSGMMTDTARALRDVQEGVGQQQMQALAGGYSEALGASRADLERQAGLASTAGQLGQGQQNIMLNAGQGLGQLGATAGGLYNTDTSNQLAAAGQLGQQALGLQGADLTGASAVTGVGNQQQQLEQAGLDTRYADHLAKQGYSQAQIDNMVKTFAGVGTGIPQGSTQTTTTSSKGGGSSNIANVLGSAATIAGGLSKAGVF